MALVDSTAEHKLVRLGQVGRTVRIHHERRCRAAATETHAASTDLHHATERNASVLAKANRGLAREIVDIRPRTCTRITAPLTHTAHVTAGIRLRTTVGAHHVHRIGRRDVVGIVLARQEHHHVGLRGNRRVAEYPAAGHAGIVREAHALQVDRGVARVVKFNPCGVVAVVVLEARVRRGHLGKDDREAIHAGKGLVDNDLVRIFAGKRTVVAALVLVTLVTVVHCRAGKRHRRRTQVAHDHRRTRIEDDVPLLELVTRDQDCSAIGRNNQDGIRKAGRQPPDFGLFGRVVSRITRTGDKAARNPPNTKPHEDYFSNIHTSKIDKKRRSKRKYFYTHYNFTEELRQISLFKPKNFYTFGNYKPLVMAIIVKNVQLVGFLGQKHH